VTYLSIFYIFIYIYLWRAVKTVCSWRAWEKTCIRQSIMRITPAEAWLLHHKCVKGHRLNV